MPPNQKTVAVPSQKSAPIERTFRLASQVQSLPFLNLLSPAVETSDRLGFLKCQRLAYAGAKEIASLLQEGWTETQAAALLDVYLRDHGVKNYFHKPFVWFGERTRFENIKTYSQYAPSRRVLRENEIVILDVAPILDGYIADIGYTYAFGNCPEVLPLLKTLTELRNQIPGWTNEVRTGTELCTRVANAISQAQFENIHQKYPFSVLGHRVHSKVPRGINLNYLNFGWQSYWAFLSRGLFGQLLNHFHEGSLVGLWAIEPHLGNQHWGAKFEEILVIDSDRAYWLEEKPPWI